MRTQTNRRREKSLKTLLFLDVNIDKSMSILWDGRQFMVKLPKELSEFYKIKKGDKLRFIIDFSDDEAATPVNRFEVIQQ